MHACQAVYVSVLCRDGAPLTTAGLSQRARHVVGHMVTGALLGPILVALLSAFYNLQTSFMEDATEGSPQGASAPGSPRGTSDMPLAAHAPGFRPHAAAPVTHPDGPPPPGHTSPPPHHHPSAAMLHPDRGILHHEHSHAPSHHPSHAPSHHHDSGHHSEAMLHTERHVPHHQQAHSMEGPWSEASRSDELNPAGVGTSEPHQRQDPMWSMPAAEVPRQHASESRGPTLLHPSQYAELQQTSQGILGNQDQTSMYQNPPVPQGPDVRQFRADDLQQQARQASGGLHTGSGHLQMQESFGQGSPERASSPSSQQSGGSFTSPGHRSGLKLKSLLHGQIRWE